MFSFPLQKHCESSCSSNIMRYVSKTCSSCRKILIHVRFERFEQCIFILGATPRIFELRITYKFAKNEGWVYSTYCILHTCKVKFILRGIIFKFSFICNNVTYQMWRHTLWEPLGYRRSPISAPFLASPNALNWWTAPLQYIYIYIIFFFLVWWNSLHWRGTETIKFVWHSRD